MKPTTTSPMVLDERFDAHVSRPISRRLARVFFKAGLSADHVSLIAAILGVSGGLLFAGGGLWPIVGGLLVIAMVVIDCADGEVARMGPPSDKPWRGRMVDGVADLATILAVHIGMVLHLTHTGLTIGSYTLGWFEIVLIAVAGWLSFAWKSSVVDDVKQRLKPQAVDHHLAQFRTQEKTLFERLLYWMLVNYVQTAEKLTGHGRPGGYELFRQVAAVGPSHHLVAVGVCGLLTPVSPTVFLLYFALTIVPGNLYFWFLLARARRDHAGVQA